MVPCRQGAMLPLYQAAKAPSALPKAAPKYIQVIYMQVKRLPNFMWKIDAGYKEA